MSILVPPHKGKWKRRGSLASIGPENIKLLGLKPAEDGKGLILRVQETSGKATQPKLVIGGKTVKLLRMDANRIATWRLTGKPGRSKGPRDEYCRRMSLAVFCSVRLQRTGYLPFQRGE